MISNTRVIAPVPSRNWPYSPAIVPRLAAIATPYSRKPVSVPMPELTRDDLVARVPEQARQRAEPEQAHQRPERRAPQREPRARRDDAPQVRVVALELPVLADVALDDPDARQRLLGGRRAPRDRVLDVGAHLLERPTEDECDGDQRWRQEQDDEQQTSD